MPPEIGIGINIWNVEKTIGKLLNSIIKQTYKDFTVYILDNQSTDRSIKIINRIKKKTKAQINLIIDKKKRDIPSAQKILVKKFLTRHKYSMIANDDDLYHPKFIKTCLQIIKTKNADMAYSSCQLLYKNKKIKFKNYPEYNLKNGKFLNTINYLLYRNIIPIFFGIYKTKSLVDSFKFYNPISTSRSNYDNQFMLYYLSKYNVEYSKKNLFFYCQRNRIIIDENKGGHKVIYNEYKSLLLIFFYQFILLKNFYKNLLINKNFSNFIKFVIFIICIIVFVQKTISYNIRFILRKLKLHRTRQSSL
jgi:glycosyltransferase involved in cell wall biosynthesis